ncbi:MAG: hypothetical protein IJW06_00505 [Clostridia bacterium]|nr:hypothetical protein [Clostridia bacterium]
MSEFNDCKAQNVILKDRSEIKISGIASVDSFDEYRICATCQDGVAVIVDGVNLTIKEVNLDSCYVEANGDIQGFFYDTRSGGNKGGFLKTLFMRK